MKSSAPRALLDPDELAAFLKINRDQVFRLHTSGRIPGIRIGQKQVRFDLEEVLRTLRNPNNRGPYKKRRKELVSGGATE
jgi:excisionase family DNA binding protein